MSLKNLETTLRSGKKISCFSFDISSQSHEKSRSENISKRIHRRKSMHSATFEKMYRRADERKEEKRERERERGRKENQSRATCCSERLNIYPHVSPVTRVVTLQFFWNDATWRGPGYTPTRFIRLLSFSFSISPKIGERIGFYERAAAKAYHATRAAAWLNVVSL